MTSPGIPVSVLVIMSKLLHFGIDPVDCIVKGHPARMGQHPYVVSIHFGWHPIPFCSGTILDNTTVLTASHCFDEAPPHCSQPHGDPNKCYQLVAGEHDLTLDEGHEQIRPFASSPSTLTRHKDYDSFHHDNDIALIRLDEPLQFNEYVKPIPLVDPNIIYKRTGAKIAGWGKLSSNSNEKVNVLQFTKVDIFGDKECRNLWGDDYHPEDMLCAGGKPTQGTDIVPDACQGDSGGPLVAKGLKCPHDEFIVGIISWGWECSYPEFPGLYTKVENYISWINEHRGS